MWSMAVVMYTCMYTIINHHVYLIVVVSVFPQWSADGCCDVHIHVCIPTTMYTFPDCCSFFLSPVVRRWDQQVLPVLVQSLLFHQQQHHHQHPHHDPPLPPVAPCMVAMAATAACTAVALAAPTAPAASTAPMVAWAAMAPMATTASACRETMLAAPLLAWRRKTPARRSSRSRASSRRSAPFPWCWTHLSKLCTVLSERSSAWPTTSLAFVPRWFRFSQHWRWYGRCVTWCGACWSCWGCYRQGRRNGSGGRPWHRPRGPHLLVGTGSRRKVPGQSWCSLASSLGGPGSSGNSSPPSLPHKVNISSLSTSQGKHLIPLYLTR